MLPAPVLPPASSPSATTASDKRLWGELLTILDGLHLHPSTRASVKGLSVCAGMVLARGSSKPIITRWTRRYAKAVRRLNALLPQLPGWPPSFRWSALQLARDTVVEEHEDANNAGPSIAVSVGNFRGGDLVVADVPHSSHDKVCEFDGRIHHYVSKHVGHRASLIAFTHSA